MKLKEARLELNKREAEVLRDIINSEVEITFQNESLTDREQYDEAARFRAMNPYCLSYYDLWILESGIELDFQMAHESKNPERAKFSQKLLAIIERYYNVAGR